MRDLNDYDSNDENQDDNDIEQNLIKKSQSSIDKDALSL